MEEKEIAKVALPRGRNGGAWRYTRVDYEESLGLPDDSLLWKSLVGIK